VVSLALSHQFSFHIVGTSLGGLVLGAGLAGLALLARQFIGFSVFLWALSFLAIAAAWGPPSLKAFWPHRRSPVPVAWTRWPDRRKAGVCLGGHSGRWVWDPPTYTRLLRIRRTCGNPRAACNRPSDRRVLWTCPRSVSGARGRRQEPHVRHDYSATKRKDANLLDASPHCRPVHCRLHSWSSPVATRKESAPWFLKAMQLTSSDRQAVQVSFLTAGPTLCVTDPDELLPDP